MNYQRELLQTIVALLLFACNTSVAHLQNVHQYIVREGYALLRNTVGDIPVMRDHVGVAQIGGRPWQTGFIVTGAWREDEEDPVYGFDNSWPPGVSGSHLWRADDGDESDVTLRWVRFPGTPDQITVPSAYKKIRRYAYPGIYGSWTVIVRFDQARVNGLSCGPSVILGVGIEYDDLIAFFKTGAGYQVGYVALDGQYYSCNQRIPVNWGVAWRDLIVWEVLGRMAHLLGDMSVPAHAHGDAHGLCDAPPFLRAVEHDTYENWVGADGPPYNSPYTAWNASNSGTLPNPYIASNPLHYLMYITQQIADHFGSNGPYDGEGNNITPYNSGPYAFLTTLLPTLGSPTGQAEFSCCSDIPGHECLNRQGTSQANRENIRDKTLPRAIQATAGLLYWFAVESELISTVIVKNDFNGGTVKVNNVDYPSGTTFGFLQGSTISSLRAFTQFHNNYWRTPNSWQKIRNFTVLETHYDSVWNNVLVDGNATYNATFRRLFNVTVAEAQYVEPGSGRTYKVNGTNVGSTWSGTFLEGTPTALTLEAVPPSGGWFVYEWEDNAGVKRYGNPITLAPTDHVIGLQAKFKLHLASSSPAALSTNQQRKFVRWAIFDPTREDYVLLYESAGQIWAVVSTDMGATWLPEVLVSQNPGTHKTPSLDVDPYSYYSYNVVWHTDSSGVDQIWSLWDKIANITRHPSISPAPVVAGVRGQSNLVFTAYTQANGIDVMKSSNDGVTWFRDTISDSLNNRYRPSLASGKDSLVYLTYDDNRRVYFDYYGPRCPYPKPCGDGWGRRDRRREEIIPGSISNRSGFTGNAQVTSLGLYWVGVVWKMQEGMLIAEKAPEEEQMEADVHHKDGIHIPEPIQYSVCFQRKYLWDTSWQPLKKFVGNNYRTPTISYVTNSKILWMWTNGRNIIASQSTNGGATWSAPTTLHTGVDPHPVLGAGDLSQPVEYVYRSLSGPIYRVGPYSGIREEEPVYYPTREIIVADDCSEASLSIEMSPLWLKTSAHTIETIPFAVPEDSAFSTSVDNVEQFLGAIPYTIPQDADSIYLRIHMSSKRASDLAQQNASLRVKVHYTVDGSRRRTAAQWRFRGDHSLNKTFRLPAGRLRGQQVQFEVSVLGLNRNNPNLRANVASVFRSTSANAPGNKIALQGREEIPQTYGLSQNFPNPFNPETIIRYQLPEVTHVTIKVYDILGRQVMTLVDEPKDAGYYQVQADASHLSSGVYLYRMTAGNYTSSRKFVLMK